MVGIYQSLTTTEAKQMIIDNERSKNFQIIDVRTSDEFSQGAIPQAANIDLYDSGFASRVEKLDKTGTYLIYCQSGNRSKVALEVMKNLEFQKVYELDDGYAGWQ